MRPLLLLDARPRGMLVGMVKILSSLTLKQAYLPHSLLQVQFNLVQLTWILVVTGSYIVAKAAGENEADPEARRPTNDAELRYWLENMTWLPAVADHGIDDIVCDDLPRGVLVGTVELFECDGGQLYVRNPVRLTKMPKPTRHPQPVWFNPF